MQKSARNTALCAGAWIALAALSSCRSDAGHAHVRDASTVHAYADNDDDGDETEVDVALADVPAAVRAAALAELPGFVIEQAELETSSKGKVYCLEGELDGEDVEIEVSADGKVLEVEHGDDEEED